MKTRGLGIARRGRRQQRLRHGGLAEAEIGPCFQGFDLGPGRPGIAREAAQAVLKFAGFELRPCQVEPNFRLLGAKCARAIKRRYCLWNLFQREISLAKAPARFEVARRLKQDIFIVDHGDAEGIGFARGLSSLEMVRRRGRVRYAPRHEADAQRR